MSRRIWILLGIVAVILAVGAELSVKSSKSVRGCVQIINDCDAPMDDLVARYAGTNIALGRLAQGDSTNVWFNAGEPGMLSIDFDQKGNPLNGFKIPDYDPMQNRRDGFKLCLTVKNNLVERSVEDDDTTTALQTLIQRIKDWIRSDLQTGP